MGLSNNKETESTLDRIQIPFSQEQIKEEINTNG
jgi:hypothetical protein